MILEAEVAEAVVTVGVAMGARDSMVVAVLDGKATTAIMDKSIPKLLTLIRASINPSTRP
jgi:hypothetical protein